MNKRQMVLRQQYAAKTEELRTLVEMVGDDQPTAEQATQFEGIKADLSRIDASLQREQALVDAEIKLGLSDQVRVVVPAPITLMEDEKDKQAQNPANKFGSFGGFLHAVAMAGINRGMAHDPRLTWENIGYSGGPSGANTLTPTEGGFLVQQDYSTQLLDLMHDQGEILKRVNSIPLGAASKGIKMPYPDETSRANGSRWGGIQAYWADEGETVTPTKPKFGMLELNVKKLIGLSYVTEEMLSDAPALETILRKGFAEELTFKTEDAIFRGTGAGKPLGFMNSGALITVAKDTNQTAATVTTTNILNMWSRMPARNRARAVWLVTQEVEAQLYALTLGSGTAVQLLYTAPGVRGQYGKLMGVDVIPVEYAEALGTVGDICLVDLGSYLMIDKGAPDAQTSMHVRFVYDEMCFRITYRVDGQPYLKKPVTPYKGSLTVSPFVALATRS